MLFSHNFGNKQKWVTERYGIIIFGKAYLFLSIPHFWGVLHI